MVDERIGTEIAGFQIRSVLGHGGMGTVYLAEQSSPRRRVALKLLRADLSSDEAFRRRFEHESEAAASTEHPNIVPIYASGQADGVLFIAMRYVEGTDLRERIVRDGTLPAERAVEIVTQVAGALDAAHRRGLVHRDVKPGNILLDEHGNAYLTDFGLIKRSEVSSGITKTGQFMGSIEYCAPEQIRGEEVDGRSDVYSLACVLYECVAGRPPFRRDTEIATLYAHLEQEPPSLPTSVGAPRMLEGVLARAMAKRPSDRYGTAGEFASKARHAVGVSSGERATPPRTARRTFLAIGAALVIVVVASVVAALSLRNGPPAVGVDGSTATGVEGGPNSIVRLDPEGGEVAQLIEGIYSSSPDPFAEYGFAAGEGGVWIGYLSVVQHVDVITGTLRKTIPAGQLTSIVVPVVGFRTVWVTSGTHLLTINPATAEILERTRVGSTNDLADLATRIATGEDAVWVASSAEVVKIDPVTSDVVARFDVGAVDGLAVGGGAVWVTDELAGELLRIDPVTGRVARTARVTGDLDEIAFGDGRVWILDRGSGTVAVVDANTLRVQDAIRVGSDEATMIFGGGSLWLADGSDGSVTRINPRTLLATTFPLDGYIADVAVDPGTGDVWALNQSSN